jgi:hypothetical protein
LKQLQPGPGCVQALVVMGEPVVEMAVGKALGKKVGK